MEGLGELLGLAMAYSSRSYHWNFCLLSKVPNPRINSTLGSNSPSQILRVQISQGREIQGCLCTVWKFTIIFDSRKYYVNTRPHLVTIFDNIT